ncbi:MAG TPA: enoyl-CoA hydratase/isomerase family protein [Candidatus Thermoplasmatota archaeon]|nr:enoyl-CoA hydratase/isomerase family protein [Candidatus Thermoplasmatota archaeon]
MFHVEKMGEKVALLRMDDGKVNAIGPAFLQQFAHAWGEATRDGRAVVLAGNAKAFSAGLDLKTLPTLEHHEMVAFARGFNSLFRDVLGYARPVVAAIDGPAMAGGAILALSSDFRLVGPHAKLAVTEVPVGIPFPAPVAQLVRARLPPPEHAPALLRGIVRAGEECVRTGWAHELRPSAQLVEDSVALATELGEHYPLAYAAAKQDAAPIVAAFDAFVKDDAERWVDQVMHEDTLEAIVGYFARVTAKR